MAKRHSIFSQQARIDFPPRQLNLKQQLMSNAYKSVYQKEQIPAPFQFFQNHSQSNSQSLKNYIKSIRQQLLQIVQKKIGQAPSPKTQAYQQGLVQLKNNQIKLSKTVQLLIAKLSSQDKELNSKLKGEMEEQSLKLSNSLENFILQKLKLFQQQIFKNFKKFSQSVKTNLKDDLRQQLDQTIKSRSKELQKTKDGVPRVQLNLELHMQVEQLRQKIERVSDIQLRLTEESQVNSSRLLQRFTQLQKMNINNNQIIASQQNQLKRRYQQINSSINSLKDEMHRSTLISLPKIQMPKNVQIHQIQHQIQNQQATFLKQFSEFKQQQAIKRNTVKDQIPDQYDSVRHKLIADSISFSSIGMSYSTVEKKQEVQLYQVDEQGYLMDSRGQYLVDNQQKLIKLQESHLKILKESKLFFDNE